MTGPLRPDAKAAGLTRRAFALRTTALATLGAAAPTTAFAAAPHAAPQAASRAASVMSFHMDRPWVDPTGRATPYLPPKGARGAARVASLSEEELRRRVLYI